MARTSSEPSLAATAIIQSLQDQFSNIPDIRNPSTVQIPIQDFFMSAFAIFFLKFPSLLQFDEEMRVKRGKSALSSLFSIGRIPSDTHMRTVLDEYSNQIFRPIFKSVFNRAQRAKVLKDFEIFDNTYCLAVDGTGHFYSDSVHCENCLEKTHKDSGEKSFYHQMLAGALVHPDKKTVIPVCPMAIHRQDGNTKNDCERNAMKRFLIQFREDHPKLKTILLSDALHSTLPCLSLLKALEIGFIVAVKPGSHEKLFEGLDRLEATGQMYHFSDELEIGDKVKKRRTRHYRFTNGVLLNHQSVTMTVNFLEFWEVTQWVDQWGELQEEKCHMSWVTDYSLYESSARQLARAGRTRWKIENETFNTLKNQGYEFEHNFGHGNKNLCSNLAHIMILAFLVDQIQEMKCPVFQTALEKSFGKRTRLFERLKYIYEFFQFEFQGWTEFLEFYIDPKPRMSSLNSS